MDLIHGYEPHCYQNRELHSLYDHLQDSDQAQGQELDVSWRSAIRHGCDKHLRCGVHRRAHGLGAGLDQMDGPGLVDRSHRLCPCSWL